MHAPERKQSQRRRLLQGGAALLFGARFGPLRAASRPLYVDGLLSSLPERNQDLEASGLDAFICDVADVEEVRDPDGTIRYRRTFATCDRSLDAALEHIRDELPDAHVATRGSEIGTRAGTGIFLQFQSCEPVAEDLSRIAYFYGKGLRVLQITHHNDNAFGGGSIELKPRGLTALGFEGVAEMNRVGMLVDVSHASERTALDVAGHTKAPFILSHGACRAIVDHPRCASDAVIRAIAGRGGVMGVFMMSFWLTRWPRPTVDHYVAQLRHVIEVGGLETVGVANDLSIAGEMALSALDNDNERGVKNYHDWWRPLQAQGMPGFERLPTHVVIPELNNLRRMQRIQEALELDGFKASEIEKIMGGNWQRVLRAVLG